MSQHAKQNTKKDTLSQLKICVEKTSAEDKAHLKKLKNMALNPSHFSKLRAAFFTAKLWPNDYVVNIAFIDTPSNIPRTTIDEIKQSMQGADLKIDPLQYEVDKMDVIPAIKKIVTERIQPIVNLKLNFIDDAKKAQVRIAFDPADGAWSLIGTDCVKEKGATMNLGWFDVATTIHEFGHTLGLIHEHQNPAGKPIDWDEAKVYAWATDTQGWDKDTTYHNIIEKYKINQINGSNFDPDSIMLYFFPGTLTKSGKGTHENLRLSPYDVQYINSVYSNSSEDATQFYKKVYGKEIPTIAPFKRSAKSFNLPLQNTGDQKDYGTQIVIGIGVFISICIIIYFVVNLFKKPSP